jgi:ATP-binding cassette subfamily C protein
MIRTILDLLSICGQDIYRPIGLLFVMSLIGASAEILGISLIFPLIGMIVDPTFIDRYDYVFDRLQFLELDDPNKLNFVLCALLGTIFVVKNSFMALLSYVQTAIIAQWKLDTNRRLMSYYMNAPFVKLTGRNSAELIRNLGLSGATFEGFLNNGLNLMLNLSIMIGVIILLVFVQPVATLIAGGVIASLFLLQTRYLSPLFIGFGKKGTSALRERQKSLQESLGAMRETRTLGKESYFLNIFCMHDERLIYNSRLAVFFGNLPPLITETSLILVMLTTVATLLLTSTSSTETIASLGLFGMAAIRLMPLVNRILMAINGMNQSRAAVNILVEEFRSFENEPILDELVKSAEARKLITDDASVEVNDVSFSYPSSNEQVLSDVSFSLKSGESVGLIGASGAGKSTLADIILGLVVPTKGNVTIGRKEIDSRQSGWHRGVGYVPQSIFITDDTIRSNIAFGISDDEIDDDHINQAIKIAHLDSLIKTLPDGLETVLGERGERLSGGQRQRIGIARAMYLNPNIIVFDEATSALDVEMEHQITSVLGEMHGKKTVIIISHRISTLKHCDKIVFMDAGKVLDVGSFGKLKKRSVKFRKLLKQSSIIIDNGESLAEVKPETTER